MFTSGPTLTAKAHGFFSALVVLLSLAVVSLLADQMVPFFPLDSSNPGWRFERMGTFLGSLPQLTSVMALLVVVSYLTSARSVVRAISVLMVILGVVALPMFLSFVLDFIEVRHIVQVMNRRAFDMAAMKTGLFGLFFAVPMIWMGIRGWRASTLEVTTTRAKGEGLVVGR